MPDSFAIIKEAKTVSGSRMGQSSQSFNQFVEKVVLHNKLVTESRLKQAKAFLDKKSDLTLLDILVKAELLKARHAELILARFEKVKAEQGPEKPSEKPGADTTVDSEKKSSFISVRHSGSQQSVLDMLASARSQGASDLHITSGQPPLIRLNGRIKKLNENVLNAEETQHLLHSILNDEEKNLLHETQAVDTCCDIAGQGRYRICMVKQGHSLDGSFRIIDVKVPSFQDLKLPKSLQRLTEYHQGLVLITGPAGMGKSTTLAAMVELVNQTRDEHIITLEDPIEYVFEPKKSHISQRAVGLHTQSFSAALRAALREDPDVILVGELRDQETASLAITASETGHLVFATLHTNSASQTIIRLLDFFPPKQQNQIRAMISESIRGIVCQRLIPNRSGTSRHLALELMFNIPAIGNMIREDKLYQLPNIIKINHKMGMILMEESIQALLKSGDIDPIEAHFAVVEQKLFQENQ